MKKLLLLVVSVPILVSCADDHSDMETTNYTTDKKEYEHKSYNDSGFTDMSTQTKQNVVRQANDSKKVSDAELQRQLKIVRERNPYLFKDVEY